MTSNVKEPSYFHSFAVRLEIIKIPSRDFHLIKLIPNSIVKYQPLMLLMVMGLDKARKFKKIK